MEGERCVGEGEQEGHFLERVEDMEREQHCMYQVRYCFLAWPSLGRGQTRATSDTCQLQHLDRGVTGTWGSCSSSLFFLFRTFLLVSVIFYVVTSYNYTIRHGYGFLTREAEAFFEYIFNIGGGNPS